MFTCTDNDLDPNHLILCTILLNYFEFGPVNPEEMSFKDISYLELWTGPLFGGVEPFVQFN